MASINGKTALYGLFGYPVEHTASPIMHNAAFEALKLNGVYLPFPVRPDLLEDAVNGLTALGIQGINVTIPHKQAIIPFLHELSHEAQTIGAVNTVEIVGHKLIGHNTDGRGFIRALDNEAGFSVQGKPVFIAGCGGAGFAVAVQCALEGASDISIMDVDLDRCSALSIKLKGITSCRVNSLHPSSKDAIVNALSKAKLVVNATPLGMHQTDPLPFPIEPISKNAVVYDVVYNLPETALLEQVRAKGCQGYGGLSMLLYQGVAAFEIWTGENAPVEVMKSVLHKQIYGVKR